MAQQIAYCRDCMEAMREMTDKAYDLAIVDPPYGGGATPQSADDSQDTTILRGGAAYWETKPRSRFGGRFSKYEIKATRTGGAWEEKYGTKVKHWDVAPPPEYFQELARVSVNQIIWGGNYFDLPPTRCFIVWRKLQIPIEGFTMSPCEYAWTSFNENAAMCEYYSSGGSGREERFHPTQKPVKLYEWLLIHYAKQGDRILDTHLGSGSSRIAAYNLGFDFTGYEIDPDYFAAQEKRFEAHTSQIRLFDTEDNA